MSTGRYTLCFLILKQIFGIAQSNTLLYHFYFKTRNLERFICFDFFKRELDLHFSIWRELDLFDVLQTHPFINSFIRSFVQQVTYQIKPSTGSTAFTIDTSTGEIKTAIVLDRETKASYKLIVQAFDQGNPRLSNSVPLNINVIDVNDNSPVIQKPIVLNPVNESASIGFKIGKIAATDRDEGVNRELVYLLTEPKNSNFFQIDSVSGEVFLKNPVDRESQDLHRVTITVKDKGNPVLSTTADYVIKVLDDNDNAPVFLKTQYSGKYYYSRNLEKI